jgi:hypothetical protein
LPPDADVKTAKSTYTSGILITFNKKVKPKGKEIKIDESNILYPASNIFCMSFTLKRKSSNYSLAKKISVCI